MLLMLVMGAEGGNSQFSPVTTWLETRFLRCSEHLVLSARGAWVSHRGDASESGGEKRQRFHS